MTAKTRKTPARRPAPPKATAPPKQRVLVATLHPDHCSAIFAHDIATLLRFDAMQVNRITGYITEFSSANISNTRNGIVRTLLSEIYAGTDWLFMVDSDMTFGPDLLETLLASADPVTAPIVGGLCFGEANKVLFPTIYRLAKNPDTGQVVTVRCYEYAPNAMEQVDATGAACLLVHRSVFERMRDDLADEVFPWFRESEIAGLPMGEDITFCLRARKLGFPIWVNTAAKTGHHKSKLLDEDAFVNQFQPVARPLTGRPYLEPADPEPAPAEEPT